MSAYMMAGQSSELERLQLQSRVWEPAGRALLERLPRGRRALDVGCGALGWLRVLAEWIEPGGEVVGSDVAAPLLAAARETVGGDARVTLVEDDLFSSKLEPASFDLVHARFQLAPLGRWDEQLEAYQRLLRPGGTLVLEDPDSSTWRFSAPAPALDALVATIREVFRAAGSDFDAGVSEAELLRARGVAPEVDRHVVALEPGHAYLRLPLQFAASLRPKLLARMPDGELDALLTRAERELATGLGGTTFTLVQTWARARSG